MNAHSWRRKHFLIAIPYCRCVHTKTSIIFHIQTFWAGLGPNPMGLSANAGYHKHAIRCIHGTCGGSSISREARSDAEEAQLAAQRAPGGTGGLRRMAGWRHPWMGEGWNGDGRTSRGLFRLILSRFGLTSPTWGFLSLHQWFSWCWLEKPHCGNWGFMQDKRMNALFPRDLCQLLWPSRLQWWSFWCHCSSGKHTIGLLFCFPPPRPSKTFIFAVKKKYILGDNSFQQNWCKHSNLGGKTFDRKFKLEWLQNVGLSMVSVECQQGRYMSVRNRTCRETRRDESQRICHVCILMISAIMTRNIL